MSRRSVAASLLTTAEIDGILDAHEVGSCDTCGDAYPLAERSMGDPLIRCGDCGECSQHCPPDHRRDTLADYGITMRARFTDKGRIRKAWWADPMARKFDPLPAPDTMRARFTDKGRIRKAYGGGSSLQVSLQPDGSALVWTIGPLGWWHDFQTIPAGTSFDGALARTHLPSFYGWDQEVPND
jgi:hypothetical protein